MGDIVNISQMLEMKKQDGRMHALVRVVSPIDIPGYTDPCVGRQSIVEAIMFLNDGPNAGEHVYRIRVGMPGNGVMIQTRRAKDLDFLFE